MNKLLHTFLLLSILTLSSCLSISNLVEAESLGKSTKSYSFAAETISVPEKGEAFNIFPSGSFQFGYGINDKFDARATISSNNYLDLDIKYQFYNSVTWDFAAGASTDFATRSPHPKIHLYSQYSFSKFSLIMNPSIEWSTLTFVADPKKTFGQVYSLSTGIVLGKNNRFKCALNTGYAPDSDNNWIFGLGVAYEIRK